MASRAFLGAGDLYIDRIDMNGNKVGREGPFECSKFEIKPNTDVKEQVSKGRTTYGQVIESVAVQKPADVSVTLTEMNKAGITLALLGTQSDFTQSAGTDTQTFTLTPALMDKWLKLDKVNLTDTVVITDDTATTTYAFGVDYMVDYAAGMFKVHSSGSIPSTGDIEVEFGFAPFNGTMIHGARDAQLRAEFFLNGINYADNLPVYVTVHEVVLAPDSALDFLSDNFGDIQLKGRCKTPIGKTEPFTVLVSG